MQPVVSAAEAGARAAAARAEREALDQSRYDVLDTPSGLLRITRDGVPVSPVLPNATTAFGWLLRHSPMSVDWALRHEGYGVAEVPADDWSPEERQEASRIARRLFRHDHGREFAGEWDEDATRSSCAACALGGYGEVRGVDSSNGELSPNYAAWPRVYVQAGRPIPRRWMASFLADLNETVADGDTVRPTRYAEALRRDVATWGVRFSD